MTDDDGWGQPTAVYGGGTRPSGRAFTPPSGRPDVRPEHVNGSPRNGVRRDPWGADPLDDEPRPRSSDSARGSGRDASHDGWSTPGRPPRSAARGAAPGTSSRADRATERSVAALRDRSPRERGLPWWAALLLLAVIAGLGGYIDTSGGALQIQGGFNIGIVVASLVAILVVRRSHMFPIVIAPPIVYTVAAVFSLYLHGGLSNRSAVIDAASNYLVYGFPAIAAATACVLIVGGIRLIIRK